MTSLNLAQAHDGETPLDTSQPHPETTNLFNLVNPPRSRDQPFHLFFLVVVVGPLAQPPCQQKGYIEIELLGRYCICHVTMATTR